MVCLRLNVSDVLEQNPIANARVKVSLELLNIWNSVLPNNPEKDAVLSDLKTFSQEGSTDAEGNISFTFSLTDFIRRFRAEKKFGFTPSELRFSLKLVIEGGGIKKGTDG